MCLVSAEAMFLGVAGFAEAVRALVFYFLVCFWRRGGSVGEGGGCFAEEPETEPARSCCPAAEIADRKPCVLGLVFVDDLGTAAM